MKWIFLKSIIAFFLTIMASSYSYACTNILIKAKDNSLLVGRTMEFAIDMHSRLLNSSRERKFQTQMINGTMTMSWVSKYGYLFADYFNMGLAVDGMNESGLSFGYLYLPGYTTYPSIPTGKKAQAIPYQYLGDWVLGNFNSITEVKAAIKNITVFAEPLAIAGQPKAIFPLHAIITDKNGDSIVIEFINGEMKVHDNKLGILTNAPTFDWQLNNLKNYANLSPYSPKPIIIDGFSYSGTGQGSGLVGLPGDPTPPSRFVKMAILQYYAMPVNDARNALILAEHILNNVDIPYGLVRSGKDEANTESIENTQWTVYKDLNHKIMYFRSYNNPTIQAIDLKKIDFSANSPQFALEMNQTAIIPDVTDKFLRLRKP